MDHKVENIVSLDEALKLKVAQVQNIMAGGLQSLMRRKTIGIN